MWDKESIGYRMFCLGFCTAAAAEAKDLDQRLRQIKAVRRVPGQPFEIYELSFNVLHRFAAGAHQVMMRLAIAVHVQRGRMRSDLPQQPTLDEKPQIVVDRGERNRRNTTSDRGVNAFWRMVSVRSDDGLIDQLTLVRDRQTVLRGQLTELFMGEAHDYRMRIIIKRPRTVSTEIFPVTSKRAGGSRTRLWLSCHDRRPGPAFGWTVGKTGSDLFPVGGGYQIATTHVQTNNHNAILSI